MMTTTTTRNRTAPQNSFEKEGDNYGKNNTLRGLDGLRGHYGRIGGHADLFVVWSGDLAMMTRDTIHDVVFGAVCCAIVLVTLWSFIGC
jgi:hypothetical protein